MSLAASAAGAPRIALALPSALVGAAVACAALVLGFNFQSNAGRPPIQYQLVMKPIGPAHNASARAGLRTTQEGTVVRLWVNNLPGKPQDVYEVFCDAKGWSASAGTFRVDAQRQRLRDPHVRGQARAVRRRSASSAGRTSPSGQVEDYDILGRQALLNLPGCRAYPQT